MLVSTKPIGHCEPQDKERIEQGFGRRFGSDGSGPRLPAGLPDTPRTQGPTGTRPEFNRTHLGTHAEEPLQETLVLVD